MRKFFLFAFLSFGYTALACDVCGGSTSFNMGSPYFNGTKGFLNSSYKYTPFRIYHPDSDRLTNDLQQEFALSFAWNWSGRFLTGVKQSYAHYYQEVSNNYFSGWRDLSLQMRYQAIKSDSGKVSFNLWFSQIHSLPTGKVYAFERLAQLSPGNNAWILGHRMDAILEGETLGLLSNYQFNTSILELGKYRFGNSHTLALSVMMKKRLGLSRWKTVSFIGAEFQKLYADLNDGENGIYNVYSGGKILQMQAKLNVIYKQILFGFNAGIPMYMHLANNSVEQGLSVGFNLKYVIN